MLRLLLFIVVLLIAGIALSSIADMPGIVAIEWMGWYVETSIFALMVVIGALFIALFALFRLLDTILGFPRRFRRTRKLENYERGLSVLTEALAAMAVSDLATAKKLNRRAEKLLASPPVTHLLAAQLARLEGDSEETTAHLKPLLKHKETRFLAVRGLLEQARKSGEVDKAIAYAEEAGHIRPDSSFAAIALIDLYTRQKRWQQVQGIIRRAKKHHALTSEEAKRYLALVDYQHGLMLYENEDYEVALRYAKSAHKSLPGMVPASLLLARCYSKLGQKRPIPQVLGRTWKIAAHPSLALLLKKLLMDETPAKRLKRIESLASYNPDDIESLIAIAEAALDDGQFDKARNHLKIALSKQETPRLCKLMSRLEETERKDKEKAEEWMQRAVKANLGPSWTCDNCKGIVEKWTVHCPECDGFDTIHWQVNRLNFVDSDRKLLPLEE